MELKPTANSFCFSGGGERVKHFAVHQQNVSYIKCKRATSTSFFNIRSQQFIPAAYAKVVVKRTECVLFRAFGCHSLYLASTLAVRSQRSKNRAAESRQSRSASVSCKWNVHIMIIGGFSMFIFMYMMCVLCIVRRHRLLPSSLLDRSEGKKM